jgi:hypothetical protein
MHATVLGEYMNSLIVINFFLALIILSSPIFAESNQEDSVPNLYNVVTDISGKYILDKSTCYELDPESKSLASKESYFTRIFGKPTIELRLVKEYNQKDNHNRNITGHLYSIKFTLQWTEEQMFNLKLKEDRWTEEGLKLVVSTWGSQPYTYNTFYQVQKIDKKNIDKVKAFDEIHPISMTYKPNEALIMKQVVVRNGGHCSIGELSVIQYKKL